MAIPKSHMQPGADPAANGAVEPSPTVLVSPGSDGGAVVLPSAPFITDGVFQRLGTDLSITLPGGDAVLVRDYFAAEPRPDLVSPDGAQHLTPSILDSFLGPLAPGQYAQAAPAAVAAPIGQVVDLEGTATAVRVDGTQVQLAKGDAVYEGDVIQTGGGSSAIRMVFTDHTEFSLGTDARLALDQLVFNPDTQSGSAQFSVLKGVFIFASGQIAKSDNTDMTVTTPVATIGIRGTEVAGRVADGDSQFTVIDGAIEVTTRAGSVTLDDSGETTTVAGNNAPPSDPVVLSPAQFGQAYGEVAGVVSSYFNQGQQGAPGTAPAGDGSPSGPDGGQPDTGPSDSDDRADAGAAAGGVMLATALPSDAPTVPGLSDPVALTSAFSVSPAEVSPGPESLFSLTGTNGGNVSSAGTSTAAGFVPGSQTGTTTSATSSTEETVLAPVPGQGLAENITFGAAGDTGGFSFGFSGGAPAPDGSVADGPAVQVSFALAPGLGAPGTPAVGTGDGAVSDVSAGSPPLDMPSSGSSGSPFRSESGLSDLFAGNPYVAQPFGYSGPQLGDAVFNLVAPAIEASGRTGAAGAIAEDDPNTAGVVTSAAVAEDVGPVSSTTPAPVHDITLVVSNATLNQQVQDLSHSYTLPDLGPGSFVLVSGSDMNLPGVGNSAEIALRRDSDGDADVTLTSSWDSVKNIRAESDTAAEIRVENFVHADVHFGNGGDSSITLVDAKRVFVTTGDGNDTISIEATSNGPGWSHRFDLQTGAGDDLVVFDPANNGLSGLTFDGGIGTDTLRLTGPAQSFDLSSGQIQLTGVERIDISGAGNVTLSVSGNLFQGLNSTTNPLTGTAETLVVDGDAGDTLDLTGNSWSQVDTMDIDGQGYTVYEHATTGMQVAADNDLQVV